MERLKAMSALSVLLWSMRITGKLSKNAGILLILNDKVPIEKEGCPSQFLTIPDPLSIGPERNKPPLAGLEPI